LTGLQAQDPDTIIVPRAFDIGIDISGPLIYVIDKDQLNAEGFFSYRLNHKYSIILEGGYSNFNYEQYNYIYNCDGYFGRIGTDINLLKPKNSKGKHYTGIGFRYGLSVFNQETPWIRNDGYWGTFESAGKREQVNAHFFESNFGVKAELFKNFIIGWSLRLRILIYSSSNENYKPVYIPGFGGTDRTLQPGMSYFLVWRIPFKD
jgi:hypothetical protein